MVLSKETHFIAAIANKSKSPIQKEEIKRVALAVMMRLARADVRALSVVFLDSKAIQKINREQRGKDYIPDVLSFRLGDTPGAGSESYDGEILLCYEQLAVQAQEKGIAVHEELYRMLIHGILHIAGFDHEQKEDARIMLPLQEEFFKAYV